MCIPANGLGCYAAGGEISARKENDVANKYDDGRADAAEGKSKDLPADPAAWTMFKSEEQIEDEKESNATYREGYADKKREMEDD